MHWVGIGRDNRTYKWRFGAREDDAVGSMNKSILMESPQLVGFSVLLGIKGILR